MAKGPTVLYTCNPALNFECAKTHCFMNGGPCTKTHNKKYAANLDKITLVLPADSELMNGVKHEHKHKRRRKK